MNDETKKILTMNRVIILGFLICAVTLTTFLMLVELIPFVWAGVTIIISNLVLVYFYADEMDIKINLKHALIATFIIAFVLRIVWRII